MAELDSIQIEKSAVVFLKQIIYTCFVHTQKIKHKIFVQFFRFAHL